jgi:hypothetical protein
MVLRTVPSVRRGEPSRAIPGDGSGLRARWILAGGDRSAFSSRANTDQHLHARIFLGCAALSAPAAEVDGLHLLSGGRFALWLPHNG